MNKERSESAMPPVYECHFPMELTGAFQSALDSQTRIQLKISGEMQWLRILSVNDLNATGQCTVQFTPA